MTTETHMAIVTREDAIADAVKAVAGKEDGLGPAGVYRDLMTLLTELERGAIPVVVVDVGADPMKMLDALEPVVNQYVQSRFVVLAEDASADVMMRAMQIGVRHVQRKSTVQGELPSVLQRLAQGVELRGVKLGRMYTILSAAGGCGATTIAVNLAHELQLLRSESALLVDLDYAYGAVGAYLGLHGRYGVADVFRYSGTIDSHLVRTTATRVSDNLYALLSPASINLAEAGPVPPAPLEHVIPAFRRGFGHTVVDAPRAPIDIAETLALASELTYIVLQPTVKDVRHAKAMLTALTSRGVTPRRLRPLLNRHRKRRQMITVADAQKALGDFPLECLSNDYTSVVRSINYGQPLADAAPRSHLRRELTKLAAEAAGMSNGRSRN